MFAILIVLIALSLFFLGGCILATAPFRRTEARLRAQVRDADRVIARLQSDLNAARWIAEDGPGEWRFHDTKGPCSEAVRRLRIDMAQR